MDHRDSADDRGYLTGVRVLEVANELGEYAGKLLAGLGADVIKVEPPGGEETRGYGPFYRDEPHPDRSLHFWHYNVGKRGIVLDLDSDEGQADFKSLAVHADVVLDTRPRGFMDDRGIGYDDLFALDASLIYARISPFGDSGPWADYAASDLIHLALGGVMMNCGYDPDPSGRYETPPIAPQMWQSYQIAGEMMVMSILGALMYRLRSGKGQHLSGNVHQAVSANTETDVPDWVYLRQPHGRLTCRHSTMIASSPALSMTKDGRYLLPYRTYLKGGVNIWDGMVALLKEHGLEDDFEDPKYDDEDLRQSTEVMKRIGAQTDELVGRHLFDADLWRKGQELGLPWAPIRRPEENLGDEHWQMRGAFVEVHHPELGETFSYVGSKWFSRDVEWNTGRRAPLLGEHTDEVGREWSRLADDSPGGRAEPAADEPVSARGKPFALNGVRVLDLSWMLASAGAGRYLAAMGAEVVKVEHLSRLDAMRNTPLGTCPPGGQAERAAATGPLPTPEPMPGNPNRGGSFMEINSGKLGMSLNLKNERGRQILEDLIRETDVIVEGFSPGTMERMGLGYDTLRELNPDIIYVQQSGFGQHGTYGQARAYGPTAQAFSGISEMSGLPEPFPPAGIGYSYLDWFGAYNMANAILAGLFRRERTGKGCYIDASQGETGIYLLGTSILDFSANERRWSRYGNRSPYKKAAPHGAYRTAGEDRWIAVAAFTDEQWRSVAQALGHPEWLSDARFATLDDRMRHQDALDELMTAETQRRDGFMLMADLQAANVPAGVCQTAQDRCESDPQLRHLEWTVELDQTEIGVWPVKDHPVDMHRTPAFIGGRLNRSGPNYGEHTDRVLREHLGMGEQDIADVRAAGAL